MIIHNIKFYRERKYVTEPAIVYDFSDSLATTNHVVINRSSFTGNLRTEISLNTSKSGGKVGDALGSPRLFTFEGQIFGANREELKTGQDFLKRALGMGVNFGQDLFKMTFTLDGSTAEYYTYVQVYGLPDITTTDNDLVLNFKFELISENFEYKLIGTHTQGSTITGAGTSFTLDVTNIGTGLSPVKVTLSSSGGFTNLKVRNNTSFNFYKLTSSVSPNQVVVFDFTRDGDPTITVNGVDKRFYRGSGSTSLFLNTGDNKLQVTSDTDMGNVDVQVDLTVNFI